MHRGTFNCLPQCLYRNKVHSIVYLNLLTETEEESVNCHCIDAEETCADQERSDNDQLKRKSEQLEYDSIIDDDDDDDDKGKSAMASNNYDKIILLKTIKNNDKMGLQEARTT